jgi:hypothetical protein
VRDIKIPTPNAEALAILAKAADAYEKLAAAHEVAADFVRTYAQHVRKGDGLRMLEIREQLNRVSISDDEAVELLRATKIVDPAWADAVSRVEVLHRIGSMSVAELIKAGITHALGCEVAREPRPGREVGSWRPEAPGNASSSCEVCNALERRAEQVMRDRGR